MIEHEVESALEGERLDRAVATVAGCSRGEAAALVDAGHVSVDGEPVTQRSRKVRTGQRLQIVRPVKDVLTASRVFEDLPEVPLRYEDRFLAVVAKPAGLVVHPAPGHRGVTLVDALAGIDPPPAGGDPERPGIVHRLDRDTSGLLVVARDPAVHAELSAMLKRREITRAYEALVDGVVEHDALTIDAPVGRDPGMRTRMAVVAEGRDAVSDVEVLERFEGATRVRVTLRTGRTHQIRVHLSAIDHPVSGDSTYGASSRFASSIGLTRPFLHATHLRFVHPQSGRSVVVDEPLPADLRDALGRLREMEQRRAGPDRAVPPHRRPGAEELPHR